jgi:hypothetical protein
LRNFTTTLFNQGVIIDDKTWEVATQTDLADEQRYNDRVEAGESPSKDEINVNTAEMPTE